MGRKTGMMFVALMSAGLLAVAATPSKAGLIGGLLGEVTGTVLSPFVTSTGLGASSTASTIANKKAAYVAVAGEAANYLQTEGGTPATALLEELMSLEKSAVAEARGLTAAAHLTDLDLASFVLQRAAEFEKE